MSDDNTQADDDSQREKLRTCPTCREEISVLAVRCRFCGSEVGRPKEASRQLTASDLGGETIYHRAPSGSVLDAMEAFRAEEESNVATPAGAANESGSPRIDDLPNLDMGAQDILNISLDEANMTSKVAPRAASGTDRLRNMIIGTVILVAVIFGAIKGVSIIQERASREEVSESPEFVNRAPSIMARGGPAIEALAAAVEANDLDPTPRNAKIEEDAFLMLKQQVTRLLNTENVDLEALREASILVRRAVELYPNPASLALKQEVDRDNTDYKLILMSTNAGTATFRLTESRGDVTVSRGDTVLDRFYVQSVVGQTVKLIDEKRGDRTVTFDNPAAEPH